MILVTSDIHVDSAALNEYRWDVFPWLRKVVEQYGVEHLCLLGDITDRKDNHGAALVNRLVDEIAALRKQCSVHLLMGNHDYVDPATPFLRFLGMYHQTTFVDIGCKAMFVPHTKTKDPTKWHLDVQNSDVVFLHQTVHGALASNGYTFHSSEAISSKPSGTTGCKVISGDIHVPQRCGRVLYCGSPHPVRFGDEWQPRVLLSKDGTKWRSLSRTCMRKWILRVQTVQEILDAEAPLPGDQVRVTYTLPEANMAHWPEIRAQVTAACAERQLVLCGVQVQPAKAVRRILRMDHPTVSKTKTARGLYTAFCRAAALHKGQFKNGRKFLPTETTNVKE